MSHLCGGLGPIDSSGVLCSSCLGWVLLGCCGYIKSNIFIKLVLAGILQV
jgi:hypothetical protein